MGAGRDSSPDPRRPGTPTRPLLSARRHPVSAIALIRHSSNESSRPQPPAIAKHATCHTLRHSGAYTAFVRGDASPGRRVRYPDHSGAARS